jgi:hypothetical protein
MGADLLSSIGTSNGCAVGGSVHCVVVVGDLLRGHRLVMVRGKAQTGGESQWRVLYSVSMIRFKVVPGLVWDRLLGITLSMGPILRACFLY